MMEPVFTFRPLVIADLELLHDWVNRPHVAEWWDGPMTFEQVRDHYTPDIESPFISPMIAYLEGEPIGFIQWYDVMGVAPGWWDYETDPGARGCDQFLADGSRLNQGLGSQMVRQFVAHLFSDPAVTKVQTDPSPENGRAIRAYEKAGFRRVGNITTPDGPALLMVIRREEWTPPVIRGGCP
jgi:RimJ/RimL family protein N-acetyltransferase